MAEPAGSGGTSEPAGSGGTSEPAGSGGTSEPAGSGGTSEPAGSGGTSEPAGSGGTSEPAGSGGTSEPADVSVSAHVAATAEEVYDLVADLPRMGQWSPECTSVAWRGGATAAAVGARFRGWNRNGLVRWFTDGVVVEAERGRALAFDITGLGLRVARWAYRFEPDAAGGGCTVTEEWTDHRTPAYRAFTGVVVNVRYRPTHNRAGMERTLARLKAAAEAGR